MKKKVLFSIALAGLVLGSCSKDAIDNGGNGASWNENGTGYISLSLNLPSTTNGSRVGEEDSGTSFDDGEAKEYAVNDAILVLFVGQDEANATFNSAYTMDLGNWEDKENQITTSARIVQKIKEIENTGGESSNKIYALVVLNGNGVLSVGNDNALTVNSSSFTGTLSALNTTVAGISSNSDVWNGSDEGFLMSNSPLFNAGGGTNNPSSTSSGSGTHQSSVLAIIDESKICSTAEKAFANPAASIYVERAQAKIQVKTELSNGEGTFTINDKDGQEVTYKYTFDKWDIDNYNKQSYLTRQFNDTWAGYENASSPAFYRFVDASPVENNAGLYRTYWGKDVNYDAITNKGTTPTLTSVEKAGEIPTLSKSMGEYTYCFENTTSVVPATGLDLTRVIISAKLAKGADGTVADFFVVNGDRSEMYLNDAATAGDGSIQKRIKSYILNDPGVQEAVKNANKTINDTQLAVVFQTGWNDASGILEYSTDYKVTTTVEGATGTPVQSAIDTALGKFTIDYYKGGVCYYQAFIRHFTESECPWTKGVDQASTDNQKKYLGRYGVLRNNWYVLNVKSISGIGDSTYPELPEEPIDKEEFYISVDINILAWAKREQDVDL